MHALHVDTLPWRKSTYSGGDSGNCVEVATLTSAVALRDSKAPHAGLLLVTPTTWLALRTAVAG